MLSLVILMNVLLLWTTVNGKPWDPQEGAIQGWSETYQTYLTQTQAHPNDMRVVFLGDSLIFGWNTTGQQYWNQYSVKGAYMYGIQGDCTQQVL